MLFKSGHAEVQAEGFTQSAAFTIAASGKAFKGLIDGLYSRKIEAVIRELATNARDSHQAAGTTKPFEIHLPTALSPTFWVRDFGTGMSHDLMMHRYSTMFDSTKDGLNSEDTKYITPDETAWAGVTGHGLPSLVDRPLADRPLPMIDPVNQQVGMLGLGSKSFFTYTDSCTITNWQDGEARYYTVYMGADGIPQISFAGSEASDEPNGVRVEFAVKTKDCAEFATAAARVFKGFPVLPDGLPDTMRDAILVEAKHSGSFWKAYDKAYLPKGGIWARQGCVLYPIDLAELDARCVETEVTKQVWIDGELTTQKRKVVTYSEEFAKFADLNMTLIIDFPIGTLEFDLGRERLAYNDRTVIALRARWADFLTDLSAQFAQTFEPLPIWERTSRALGKEFKDMGVLFTATHWYVDAENRWDALLNTFDHRDPDTNEYIYGQFKHGLHHDGGYDDYPIRTQKPLESSLRLHGMKDAVFLVIDEERPKMIHKRTRHYMESKGIDWAFTFHAVPDKALLKALGSPKLVKTSELPPAPKAERKAYRPSTERGMSYFDRIKVINARTGSYSGATDVSQYEDNLFCFMNCGTVHNPDPDNYPTYDVQTVIKINEILTFFTGRSISFINIKSNEFDKLDKWADFPLFYGCLDNITEHFTDNRGNLKDLINAYNDQCFQNTNYEVAADRWHEVFPNDHNPLIDLRRFNQRYKNIPEVRRRQLDSLLRNPVFKPLIGHLVEYAKAAGLEVLPEMNEATWHEPAMYPYPLLPKGWEKIKAVLGREKFHTANSEIIFTALKEKFGC